MPSYIAAFTWIVPAVVLAILTVAFSTPINEETTALNYIGAVQEKSYFVESVEQRTWAEAHLFCNSSGVGMRLSSVRTPAEVTFLNNANSAGLLTQAYYWTSGRDAQTHAQFAWDNDGVAPTETVITYLHINTGIHNCLTWHSGGHFDVFLCTAKKYTLCEVVVGKEGIDH